MIPGEGSTRSRPPPRAATTCSRGASGGIPPTSAASTCGWWGTTCARARPRTPSRWRSCWWSVGCSGAGRCGRLRASKPRRPPSIGLSNGACQYLPQLDGLDPAPRTGRGGEPPVGGNEDRIQGLGERHVHRVPPAHGVPELPGAGEQEAVTETLAGPGLEILDRLCGLGAVQAPAQVLAPDYAEDLRVDDVRCRVIAVGGQPLADRPGAEPSDQNLAQAGSVNDKHRATSRAARRAPRGSRR